MTLPIEYVEANGLRHAYVQEGTGPLVLTFHGSPDTPDTWRDLRPGSRRRRVPRRHALAARFLHRESPEQVAEKVIAFPRT